MKKTHIKEYDQDGKLIKETIIEEGEEQVVRIQEQPVYYPSSPNPNSPWIMPMNPYWYTTTCHNIGDNTVMHDI